MAAGAARADGAPPSIEPMIRDARVRGRGSRWAAPDEVPIDPSLPTAASVIRRALLLWGLGHLAIGDRRGWLLAALEIACLAGVVLLAVALIEGDRADLVFLALAGFVALWGAQAIDAHSQAVALGARPGGAFQIVLLAPLAIAVFTAFWLVGGSLGSPAATLQRYVTSWRDDRPAVAARLFVTAPQPQAIRDGWTRDAEYLRRRVAALAAQYGSASGLDAAHPFESLSFDVASAPPGPRSTAIVVIRIVRRVTVQRSIFGIFPAASQETRRVEDAGRVLLRAVDEQPRLGLPSSVWRIDSVEFGS